MKINFLFKSEIGINFSCYKTTTYSKAFFLPVESGEKVNLEMTILLALVVFLLMVGESMPPTPDAIPILGELPQCHKFIKLLKNILLCFLHVKK